jgi:hypothetical protein
MEVTQDIDSLIRILGSPIATDYDMAKMMWCLLGKTFICYNPDEGVAGVWYMKNEEGEWVQDKYCKQLRETISTKVHYKILEAIHSITFQLQTLQQTDRSYESNRQMASRLAAIATNMQTTEEVTKMISIIKYNFVNTETPCT